MIYGLHLWSWTWHWSLYVWLFDFGFCIRPCIYMCCVYSVLVFTSCGAYITAFFLGDTIYHVSPDFQLSIDHSAHTPRLDFNPSTYPSRNQSQPIQSTSVLLSPKVVLPVLISCRCHFLFAGGFSLAFHVQDVTHSSNT